MEANPLSIIVVKSDSKGGDRLLFRYPTQHDGAIFKQSDKSRRNPYALVVSEDLQNQHTNNILSDQVLSNLFAVKPELCDQKFELKVNDVRFVGHPIQFPSGHAEGTAHNPDAPSTILINVVFALHSHANHSIVKCYYDLSKRLGIALRHEEKRCCYVSTQSRDMISVHDEVAQRMEAEGGTSDESPYELILQRCSLARDLQRVFESLCDSGLVQIQINEWIEVSFCLPHKVHQMPYMKKGFVIEPAKIDACLKSIRPYHGLLLLVDAVEFLDSLPSDSSPALARLLHVYSPIKSLQNLSADSDLTLSHVYQLAGHLLYWAKAMFIYPVCKTNLYTVAPDACTDLSSPLAAAFRKKFPGRNLIQEMGEFFLPTSMNQKINPLVSTSEQQLLLQMIAWMLQHRQLLQLHTYVHFTPEIKNTKKRTVVAGSEASQLLAELSSDEQTAILESPAAENQEDLALFCKLLKKGYLTGKHHLEEIMYFENLKRSQLLCILDKFRDNLILCEMEDPAIAMFYPHSQG